jgi:uncharacterized protein with FMN-binding domain
MEIFLIILGVVAVIAIPMLFLMFYGIGSIKRLVIREVDPANVPDGTYSGSYHKGRWTYDVELVIQDHRITAVKNTNKRMEMFQDFNNALTSALLEKQYIPFDTVSGATINTKAFLKAVENALAPGK